MSRPSWIGQVIGGRYRIDELLGQGGMSAVYKAYDPNLKRVIAVKLIHAHLADDPRFLVRFEEEAAAVAQLRHPNIVQVYDFNHDGDVYYMIQEFVPGESLQERLRRLNQAGRRLPLRDAIRYAIHISDATGYAHRRGMIHRDIKPANIMLDVNDQAILMDFGIVKILGGTQHTATGAVVGTALYLPPELIRGEAPDPRADLYSLGVTLFEMVNGRPPFEASSAMTLMMMHLNDPVPDLRGLRPEVPESLIAVIEQALAKDRDQRYSSMADFATALVPVLNTLEPGKSTGSADQPAPLPKATRSQGPAESYVPTVADEGLKATPTQMDLAQPDSHPAGASAYPSTLHESGAGTPASQAARTFQEAGTSASGVSRSSASQPAGGSRAYGAPPDRGTGQTGAPGVGGSGDRGSPPSSGALPRPKPGSKGRPVFWAAGAVALLLLCMGVFAVAGVVYSRFRDRSGAATATLPIALAFTETLQPNLTPTATATPPPTATNTPEPSPTPTETPTPTVSPTPTIPVGVPYAVIQGISTDDQQFYVVNYTTFEYNEQLPGAHVHFFFNTTPPDQAGRPGSGIWYVWGGPRPFNRFRQSDRPEHATQMCILVANPDHSVKLESGNCFILPDIVVAAPFRDMACLFGPALQYPGVVSLPAGQITLVRGISPDEAWWNVEDPQNPTQTCWLPRDSTAVAGDISTLGLVEPPPLPTAAGSNLFVEISGISVDDQGRYVVSFTTTGFTPALPGTHIHFFFNTVSADQVGMAGAGNRLMFGGLAPFTGYRTADRPAAATQICALVANPDHSVNAGSGNCFQLPDVP